MAKCISDLCEEQKLSPEALAEKAGLEPERALAIILGRWTPSPTEREKVAAALGVSKDEVAWGHVTPIQHIYGHGPG